MARTRSIKPGFFKNETLATLPYQDRILFIGLWCIADREGRLEDRPKRIHVEVFPYDPDINVEISLLRLIEAGFIQRYEVAGNRYILLPTFKKHQHVHVNEQPSTYPAPYKHGASPVLARPSTLPPLYLPPLYLPPSNLENPVKAEFDEQWEKFKADYEAVKPDLIPEDWSRANYCWRVLDFDQKTQAISGIQLRLEAGQWRDPQFVPKPDKYLREDRKRKVYIPKTLGERIAEL